MGLIDKLTSWFRSPEVQVENKASAPANLGSDGDRQGTGAVTYVGSFLTSPETNSKLSSGPNRYKTYDNIKLNVAIVATALRYISALVSATNWNIQPPKAKSKEKDGDASDAEDPVGSLTDAEAKKAKEYADYITHNMKLLDQPWFKIIRNCSQFKWDGFVVLEMIARRMDDVAPGYIGIGSIEHRPKHTIEEWDLEPQSNEVARFGQRDPNTAEVYWIDRDKCVYINDDTLTQQPDGVGLLRHVVELCEQLKRLEQLEGWAYETDLRGVPLAWAPTAILDDLVAKGRLTPEDRDGQTRRHPELHHEPHEEPEPGSPPRFERLYRTRCDTATPSAQKQWDMSLMKGSGTGLAEINVAIERKQHEIARALGVEQFMLGAGGKGSLALSEDKARSLVELINSIILEIAWCLQRDFIRKIFILNRWPLKLMPELLPDAAALRSVTTIVDALSKLALAGAVLDRNDPVINQIRGMLKLIKQPFITPEMMQAGQTPNDGGAHGNKSPGKPPPSKESKEH
jgi:hypothetical protein